MKQAEKHEQASLVYYARIKYPGIVIIISPILKLAGTPKQQMIQAVMRKKMGYEAGTPDILFAEARGGWHGLFIEMKRTGGVASDIRPEQKDMAERLTLRGYKCCFCFGYDQAVATLSEYMSKRITPSIMFPEVK